MKTLVAYFSAEGTTKRIAEAYAKEISADCFEIIPQHPYSSADLRWTNPLARCNWEKIGNKDVPVAGKVHGFEEYDTVFLGFPIWYGCAPNVVNTFCKGYDWHDKKVYAFATSGGSGIGKTDEKLKLYVSGAASVEAKLTQTLSELEAWGK